LSSSPPQPLASTNTAARAAVIRFMNSSLHASFAQGMLIMPRLSA
jgi:hypothetical protein